MKDEPTYTAVELSRQEQADDGRLDVFLLILVCVKGVSQVGRDVIWEEERKQALCISEVFNAYLMRYDVGTFFFLNVRLSHKSQHSSTLFLSGHVCTNAPPCYITEKLPGHQRTRY